ncbi:MAG: hypothetical protein PHY45_12500 [Rhodocyclaceae bacterium]|nr:hypothetical protein [Rhodocyclaceae bacterium]
MAVDRIKAWQCIGCGKIEAPQTCVGVCRDRRVEFVYASEHEEALALQRQQSKALEALARQLAYTTPRDGEWERSFRALQHQARQALAALADAAPAEKISQ